jgi:hypothetical protein
MDGYFEGLYWPRLVFVRGLAAIFVIAFVSALNQWKALLGERGLQPVPRFLEHTRFREAPSLFHFHYSDRFFTVVAGSGLALSIAALLGLADAGPFWLGMAVWLSIWALYLSIVNVGQTFYAFGWESMLVEAGFFAAFMGPRGVAPSAIPMLAVRWMLFRVELGAGLIKIRHDECWRNLTCLFYHHETQPLPNPLSRFFHRSPKLIHKTGVLFSHFVQLVAPFGLFFPQPVPLIAGAFIVVHQLWLVVSGNYAWLNWLTIVLAGSTLSDSAVGRVFGLAVPALQSRSMAEEAIAWSFGAGVLLLSYRPAKNLVSKRQLMNFNYNAFHLVNAYGAFGSVTRERYEIVLEGTTDERATPETRWFEYELKAKPGDPMRRPRQIAPYHLRLDWLMWFLPFSIMRAGNRVIPLRRERWFLRLVRRLLEGDKPIKKLLGNDPFPSEPPKLVRARYYRYRYADPASHRESGAWWTRELVGEYLPPVAIDDLPT